MLILLDENLPHVLRLHIQGHEVRTTAFQGWSGLTNGDLIQAAEAAGFEALITADQSVYYQQNRTDRKMALIVLSSNRTEHLLRNLAVIQQAIANAAACGFVFVDLS